MDTIRARQIDALVQMLNLHGEKKIKKIAEENGTEKNRRTRFYDENSVEDDGDEVVWKVLVIDEFSRDVISTVLKVSDLRENGITVHM
ncbi:Sec1 family domain-containing protein 1 [Zancudomyces culisetae]|uniref:Sec1 family domain-containing protein 1 n=1 Tax=Zancudomyces culisetae TaxID=1213189 RepID=A0A1R1PLC5_ZANCU|nr:Sec1 family domain-containing protein 1 [Zancudomyces culisetae]|eukprot:OMH81672.1 Sec1 family domain-containing protein 1 [Zancudomyces culisetae]